MSKTAFKLPDELQNSGDICESCRRFWEAQGLPPMEMVYVLDDHGDPLTTGTGGTLAFVDDDGELYFEVDDEAPEGHEIPIVVCPRCDGDPILRLPKE